VDEERAMDDGGPRLRGGGGVEGTYSGRKHVARIWVEVGKQIASGGSDRVAIAPSPSNLKDAWFLFVRIWYK
jgi:hypothetical protein